MTYMVTNGDGNAITDGLQEHEARRIAQQIANRRGESVWLSQSHTLDDDGNLVESTDEGEEFEPE